MYKVVADYPGIDGLPALITGGGSSGAPQDGSSLGALQNGGSSGALLDGGGVAEASLPTTR